MGYNWGGCKRTFKVDVIRRQTASFVRGGGTPLCRPHRYVPSQTVWFLRRFGLKKRYRLCPFWSGIGYGFEGITGVYGGIYRFNSKWVRKKEKYADSKWNLRNLFCCCSDQGNFLDARSENGYGFYRLGLKSGVKNDIIWSEMGSGLENQAAHLHQEIPRVPPGLFWS